MPRCLNGVVIAVLIDSLALVALNGQESQGPSAANRPAFEVASVKPNTSGQFMSGPRPEVDRLTATNVNVRVLIQAAYNMNFDRVLGGPSWVGTNGPPNGDRFDIVAKAEKPFAPRNQWQLMLQTLLADRFKLKVHTETRSEDVYNLVVARSDRKLGPNLHPSTTDCFAAVRAATQRPDGPRPEPLACGDMARFGIIGKLNGRGVKLDQLLVLQGEAGRRIVNKTGLDGFFDWDLTFTPRAFANRQFDRERFPLIDPEGPTIFTALQEQLGLKLEGEKSTGEFLIIDSVEHPTPD